MLTTADVQAARDELARRNLADFACSVDIPTVPVSADPENEYYEITGGMRVPKLTGHHNLICTKLDALHDGAIPNLMLLLPPGSAKSTYTDVVAVPHYMAKKPRFHVILASYASAIAGKQGRRARQLIQQPAFERIHGVTLDPSKSAADEWMLTNGSEYMAGGILSGLTGNRAMWGILDDPIRGREAAESETIREKTWDAYSDDFCSRLVPGAPQTMILCMTGDTPVLMADATEKLLRDVRPGDYVASLDGEGLAPSRVMNWANQGPDSVYEIRMSSGITVRANERHPFLVKREGGLEWVRLRNLKGRDEIVSAVNAPTKDAILERTSESGVTAMTRREAGDTKWAIMGDGLAPSAPSKIAISPSAVKGFAASIMAGSDGQTVIGQLQPKGERGKTLSSATDMASELMNMSACSSSRTEFAQCACVLEAREALSIGQAGFALTTTIRQEGCADCSAMTATSSLGGVETPPSCGAPLNTWRLTSDTVLSILPCGNEDVFDIQVEGTENFIANGLVSHNTRWHADDPAGRILPEDWDGESGWFDGRDGRKWYVVCLPAIADRVDDPLGRKIGETLWPEWFSMEHWAPFMRNSRTWSSLYQQKPSPDEGTFLKAEWFKRYTHKPAALHCYMTSDHAPKGGVGSDWSVFNIWGVDDRQHLYLLEEFRTQGTMDVAMGVLHDADGDVTLAEEGALPLIRKWKPLCWFPEDDVTWKANAPFVQAAMRRTKVHCRIEPLSTAGGDKPTKARPFQAKASMGEVFLPTGFMGDEVLKEYKQFPAGKHDDRVDAAAHIGRALDMAHPAIVKTVAPQRNPGYGDYRRKPSVNSASAWG